MCMQAEDAPIIKVDIKRPRDHLTHQLRTPVTVSEYLDALATTKRVKKEGYALYVRAALDHQMSEQEEYFLTWSRGARAGSPSVATTETYRTEQGSAKSSDEDMREAREHLSRLEDLTRRIEAAMRYLAVFRGRNVKSRVVSLESASVHLRAGGKGQPKEPSKWESRNNEPGLRMYTKLTVKGQSGGQEALAQLDVEQMAEGAFGCILMSWETWTQSKTILSDMPLVVALPGRKMEQVVATEARKQEHVKVQDVVLIHPHAESGKERYFTKTVTFVNHTRDNTKVRL